MRSKRSFIVLIVVVTIAGLVLAACGENDGTQAQQSPTPSPSPTETTHPEDEWTIVTPAGWTRADATSTTDAKKAVRYEGPDGEYVIIAIDPLGSDFAADTVWRYEVKGDRFEIVSKEDCTSTAPESGCSTDDARYDGYVMWKSGSDPQKVGGHTWYFIFGNTQKTTVDPVLFEEIIESIRVKG